MHTSLLQDRQAGETVNNSASIWIFAHIFLESRTLFRMGKKIHQPGSDDISDHATVQTNDSPLGDVNATSNANGGAASSAANVSVTEHGDVDAIPRMTWN